MNSFLEQLAEELIAKHENHFDKLCVVFPTRRASLYFKRAVGKHIEKPIWLPATFSITDFMAFYSGLTVADDITLIFHLYEVWQKHLPGESFEQFYPWGQLLLNDFDDADRNLCNTKKLFADVRDLKQIDEEFSQGEEEKEMILNFWKTFYNREPGILKNKFSGSWQKLYVIYEEYKRILVEKNIGYEGLAYRLSCENIDDKIHHRFDKIVFAGFYALSKSEEKIIQNLQKKNKAVVYWDADSYYTDDTKQEAGFFLRKNRLITGDFLWKGKYFSEEKKNIEVIGAPNAVAMAKDIGNRVEDLIATGKYKASQIAVVLPDEKSLLPMLHSIPESVSKLNVTMGFPLKGTSVYHFIQLLKLMSQSFRKNGFTFYYLPLMNLLQHPMLQHITQRHQKYFEDHVSGKKTVYTVNELKKEFTEEIFLSLFEIPFQSTELFNWLKNILLLLVKSNEKGITQTELAFASKYYNTIQQLQDIMSKSNLETDMNGMWMLLNDSVSNVRIPFNGEPVEGLQLMGFLETRLLDYKCIFVLDVNEGILPPNTFKPSFIPYSLRKAFGMTTYEDSNAVNAYHFYRLLQRSDDVHLYYNMPSEKGGGRNERSRYILQLKNELKEKAPSVNLHESVLNISPQKVNMPEITIRKDAAVMKELEKFTGDEKKNPSKRFSASSLNIYLSCELKFYFSKVAEISEEDEMKEEIDAAELGNVFHHVMQHLYQKGKTYSSEDIDRLVPLIDIRIDNALKSVLKISSQNKNGFVLLMEEVIRSYVHQTLKADKAQTPFTVVDLEQRISKTMKLDNGKIVSLSGVIDRIDKTSKGLRIVDYKTGRVMEHKEYKFEDIFSVDKYKEVFQTHFYYYLINQSDKVTDFHAAIYRLKEMSKGVYYVNEAAMNANDYFEFEKGLKTLITQVLSGESFRQTADLKKCSYCPYNVICNRTE